MKDKRLLVVFLTVFVDLVGFGIIIPLNPYLARHFGASPFEVGLLMTIYSFMQFLFAPLWGQLSDRYGRRPVMLVSLFGSAVSHFGFGMSTHLWGLFAARACAGLFGGNISAAMAYIADITSEKDRSKGMGMVGAAFGLGFILGPTIGGLAADFGHHLGETPPFGPSFSALIASAICLINFLLALRYLRESLTPERQAAAVSDPRRQPRFKRIFQTLRVPTLNVVLVMFFFAAVGMGHMEASLFMYVQDLFGWSMSKASIGFAYVGFIMALTQGGLIRRVMPMFGERALLICGLIMSASSLLGIGFSNEVWLLGVAVTLLALGNGLVNPSINGSISLLSSPEEQGANMGVAQSLASLGRILGPASGGWVYQHMGPSFPFWIAAVLTAFALGLGLMVRQRLPNSGKAHVH